MRLSLIVALAENRVIGRRNELPWRIPEDLKRFKNLTLGHPVIMGRRTFESIVATVGGPLPGRENIVITRNGDLAAQGSRIVRSPEEAIAAAVGSDEAFVIGGAQIYALTLPLVQRLYLTEIDAIVEGDAYFPEFDRGEWREILRESRFFDGPGGFRYHFVIYER